MKISPYALPAALFFLSYGKAEALPEHEELDQSNRIAAEELNEETIKNTPELDHEKDVYRELTYAASSTF